MTEATSDDRTVQHDTIVIDRRFAAAPARVFGARSLGRPWHGLGDRRG
jgi:hypothetical protein